MTDPNITPKTPQEIYREEKLKRGQKGKKGTETPKPILSGLPNTSGPKGTKPLSDGRNLYTFLTLGYTTDGRRIDLTSGEGKFRTRLETNNFSLYGTEEFSNRMDRNPDGDYREEIQKEITTHREQGDEFFKILSFTRIKKTPLNPDLNKILRTLPLSTDIGNQGTSNPESDLNTRP